MKKTLLTCLAVAAALAIAGPALAITCTVDQHPAATLLVPYFQVSYDDSGNLVSTGPDARDTIVTFANASSAPMIAHVDVWDRQSVVQLDFDVALTGFDVQAMRLSDILSGFLPITHDSTGADVCQRNGSASVYPAGDGFLRVRPTNAATESDSLATTLYASPAFNDGGALIEAMRTNCDGGLDALAIGYLTIDHANYCTLSNPTFDTYYYNDAIGMENNLWGEIIFTSGGGLPTYAMSTVNVEADFTIGNATLASIDEDTARSFYAKYYDPAGDFLSPACPNCSGGNGIPCPSDNSIDCNAPFDVGYGDQREPLGLRYATRWFDAPGIITTNFRVWRSLTPGFGGDCIVAAPPATLTFLDEDENGVGQGGGCPSQKCGTASNLFPLETQQVNITAFTIPTGGVAGWVQMDFAFATGEPLDQAWADYSFEGTLALESILVPGTQLDPSTCNPLTVTDDLELILPAIPALVGSGT